MGRGTTAAADARRAAFAEALVGKANFNLAEAARLAGYQGKSSSVLSKIGAKLLHSPYVQQLLERRAKEAGLTLVELFRGIAEDLEANVADYLQDDGTLDLASLKGPKSKMIREVRFHQDTGAPIALKLIDRQRTQELLLRAFGVDGKQEERAAPGLGIAGLWDDDKTIQALLDLGVARDKWPPHLVALYEKRTKPVASREAQP